jgi:hypothetical protein
MVVKILVLAVHGWNDFFVHSYEQRFLIMKQLIILIGVLFFIQPVKAQDSKSMDTITSVDAAKYIGKKVLLCDRVNYGRYVRVEKDQPKILYVGPDYPKHNLVLVFTQQNLRYFSFDPERKMINKRFCIRGTITKYKGKPAIFVTTEDQLNEEE